MVPVILAVLGVVASLLQAQTVTPKKTTGPGVVVSERVEEQTTERRIPGGSETVTRRSSERSEVQEIRRRRSAELPPAGTVRVPGAEAGTSDAPPVSPQTPVPQPQPEFAIVPELVGLNREQAVAAIKEAHLTLGVERLVASDRQGGTVIAQRPRAGMRVPFDAQVHLILAEAEAVTPPPAPPEEPSSPNEASGPPGPSDQPEQPANPEPSPRSYSLGPTEPLRPVHSPQPPSVTVRLVGTGTAILVALLGGAYFWSRKYWKLPRSISFQPHPDPGSSSVGSGLSFVVESEVRFRCIADLGRQRIEGKVVSA
ncbi:MAG TPA: PASTA domain-containing protein [Bryobacteraceae bacterium]|nr:PASTA domain-containing protein [Bryobacteraceae bacterium]